MNEKSGAIVGAVIVLPTMAPLSSFTQMKIFLFALLSSVKVSELMAWEVCLSGMGDSNCKYVLGSRVLSFWKGDNGKSTPYLLSLLKPSILNSM